MLKLNKILTITLLLASSLHMQSSFADESTALEGSRMAQLQSTLNDWNQKTQTALTSRLEKKLQHQLIAKSYNIVLPQEAILAETVHSTPNIVLAAN